MVVIADKSGFLDQTSFSRSSIFRGQGCLRRARILDLETRGCVTEAVLRKICPTLRRRCSRGSGKKTKLLIHTPTLAKVLSEKAAMCLHPGPTGYATFHLEKAPFVGQQHANHLNPEAQCCPFSDEVALGVKANLNYDSLAL
jgi:hypothetical protein